MAFYKDENLSFLIDQDRVFGDTERKLLLNLDGMTPTEISNNILLTPILIKLRLYSISDMMSPELIESLYNIYGDDVELLDSICTNSGDYLQTLYESGCAHPTVLTNEYAKKGLDCACSFYEYLADFIVEDDNINEMIDEIYNPSSPLLDTSCSEEILLNNRDILSQDFICDLADVVLEGYKRKNFGFSTECNLELIKVQNAIIKLNEYITLQKIINSDFDEDLEFEMQTLKDLHYLSYAYYLHYGYCKEVEEECVKTYNLFNKKGHF